MFSLMIIIGGVVIMWGVLILFISRSGDKHARVEDFLLLGFSLVMLGLGGMAGIPGALRF